MPNSLKLLNHYILNNAPQKIRQLALKEPALATCGRINFKILLVSYKILNGQSAGYLEPLIEEYHPTRALRSSSRSLLCTPVIKSKTYGGRAFSTAAPQLWSAIPEYVKNAESVVSFKTKLKTFLFRKFFY